MISSNSWNWNLLAASTPEEMLINRKSHNLLADVSILNQRVEGSRPPQITGYFK
jgi:hypothetical protein